MKNIKFKTTFFTLLISCCLTITAQAQNLDTLFSTQEERDYLDLLRKDFLAKNKENDFDIDKDIPTLIDFDDDEGNVPAIVEFKLGGIISQSNGTHRVWLNDTNLAETELPDNMQLITSNGSLALQINEQGKNFILKTGQTINISTGHLQEAYQIQATAPLPKSDSNSKPEPEPTPELEAAQPQANNTSVNSTSTLANLDQIPEELQQNSEFMAALQAMEEALSED